MTRKNCSAASNAPPRPGRYNRTLPWGHRAIDKQVLSRKTSRFGNIVEHDRARGSVPLFEENRVLFPRQIFHLQKIYFFSIVEYMGKGNHFGELELLVMLALVRLDQPAYGVSVAREI